MAVKIRLQRRGKKGAPFYHIVIADARSPRDGRFIEKVGTYNPMTKPATIELDRDTAYNWLMKGAQPTETVRAILRFKGVTYRKHLLRGVAKGVITQEVADQKYHEWIDAKDEKTAKRREQAIAEINAFNARVAGLDLPFTKVEKKVAKVEYKTAPAPVVVAEAAEETPAVAVVDAPIVETVTEVVESPVVEAAAEIVEAPVAEEVEAPVAEEVAETTEEAAAETTEEAAAEVE